MRRRGRLGLLLGFVFVATVATVAPAGAAGANSATSAGPLPACRYDDVPAALTAYSDWKKTLLDPIYTLPSTYVPPGLVPTSDAGIAGGGLVRSNVIADLRAMRIAAKAARAPIAVSSAYRSYTKQAELFDAYVEDLGYEAALLRAARPGHSEHQLGSSIDFRSKLASDTSPGGDWARSRAGAWMAANGWKYGWVMSYPAGKTDVTCYNYEPWHYRYFGRSRARLIIESGLTVREWLWQQGYGDAVTGESLAPAA